jgi:hypothetical protein
MLSIAVLNTVSVSSTELCPGSPDRGAAFRLWEQARFGLLATVVAREAKPAAITSLLFQRNVWPNDSLVHIQTTERVRGYTARPFVASSTPATFAANGYAIEERDGSRTYSAPDADVLLDETFAETHCFHVQRPDGAHPNQDGLAFVSMTGRDSLVEVVGVVWIDHINPVLRSLEFRYIGIEPSAERANAGGRLEFRTMANGITLIESWSLRLPLMTRPGPTLEAMDPTLIGRRPAAPRRRQDRVNYRVNDVRETGGQVIEAEWADGTHWEAARTGLSGTVVQRGTQAPVPFAIVSLVGTSDSTIANATGDFTLAPLIAGRYSVEAVDTTLRTFAPERSDTKTMNVVSGRLTVIRPEVSTLSSTLANACQGRQAIHDNTVTILGHVSIIGTNDQALSSKQVFSSWLFDNTAPGTDRSREARVADQLSAIDAAGRFLVCGVGANRFVQFKMREKRGIVADTSIFVGDSGLVRFEWRRPPLSASTLTVATLARAVDVDVLGHHGGDSRRARRSTYNRHIAHSLRSASMRSIVEARRAGATLAATATVITIATPIVIVTGSRGEMPNTNELSMWPRVMNNATPMMIPPHATRTAFRTTPRTTSPAFAPKARRMPISFVRRAVV